MLHILNYPGKGITPDNGRVAAFLSILEDLGIPYKKCSFQTWKLRQPSGLTIVLNSPGDPSSVNFFNRYCEIGNSILAIGHLCSLETVLGLRKTETIREGWVRWEPGSLAKGLMSSFHFFDATAIEALASDVETSGILSPRTGAGSTSPALCMRRVGKGIAAFLAVDLIHTVSIIRNGVSVLRDGFPAPDGSGNIVDGRLKTDDGAVLDWARDRTSLGSGTPFYLYPIVDEWLSVLARVVGHLCHAISSPHVILWFWPNGLEAIGHISHDSDGNSPQAARGMLECLSAADVKSTWCIIAPGYDPKFNQDLAGSGHEIALHYNAVEFEEPPGVWSKDAFAQQLASLKSQFPGREIITNKNHYLRWEGDAELFQWCEEASIRVEQSKGGSKPGNKGFLFGTCHAFRPRDTAKRNHRPDVLCIPTLAWDPPMAQRCSAAEAEAIFDSTLRVHGIAHFIFHPAMLVASDAPIRQSLVELVRYGRAKGADWWTSQQIYEWTIQRRQIRVQLSATRRGLTKFVLSSATATQGLTLLLMGETDATRTVSCTNGGILLSTRLVERFGRNCTELLLDIHPGRTCITCNDPLLSESNPKSPRVKLA